MVAMLIKEYFTRKRQAAGLFLQLINVGQGKIKEKIIRGPGLVKKNRKRTGAQSLILFLPLHLLWRPVGTVSVCEWWTPSK